MTETVPSSGRGGTAAGLFRLSRENSGTISKFADILRVTKVNHWLRPAARTPSHEDEVCESSQPREQWRCTKRPTIANGQRTGLCWRAKSRRCVGVKWTHRRRRPSDGPTTPLVVKLNRTPRTGQPAGAITDQHAAPHDDPAIRRDPLTFLPSYRCLPRRPRRRILALAAAASRIT